MLPFFNRFFVMSDLKETRTYCALKIQSSYHAHIAETDVRMIEPYHPN